MVRTRRVGEFLVLTLLVFTGVAGLKNGPADLPVAEGLPQVVVSLAVTLYGVAGVIAALSLWTRRRWTLPVMIAWGVSGVVAAVVSPRAYGSIPAPWWSVVLGLVSAAAVAAVAITHAATLSRRPRATSGS